MKQAVGFEHLVLSGTWGSALLSAAGPSDHRPIFSCGLGPGHTRFENRQRGPGPGPGHKKQRGQSPPGGCLQEGGRGARGGTGPGAQWPARRGRAPGLTGPWRASLSSPGGCRPTCPLRCLAATRSQQAAPVTAPQVQHPRGGAPSRRPQPRALQAQHRPCKGTKGLPLVSKIHFSSKFVRFDFK